MLARLLAPFTAFGRRLADELCTSRGRRRLGRRVASRFLVLLPVLVWTNQFTSAFWTDEVTRYVRGRVVVAGSSDPVRGLAVVLVPAPVRPGDGAGYLRVDPGPGLDPAASRIWLWPDVDGWFDAMHVGQGRRYRVEIHWTARPECPPHVAGHRVFRLLNFFSRRLELVVSPCAA